MSNSIYPKGKNPFACKKLMVFKQTFIYPNEGPVRFQIQLDKNGQVYEIRRSYAQVTKNPETKKKSVKISLGDRPRVLFDHIKGRPVMLAFPWIDMYLAEFQESED